MKNGMKKRDKTVAGHESMRRMIDAPLQKRDKTPEINRLGKHAQ